MPRMSKERGAFSARWSSRISTPRTRARTPTGTLMKNTDCQLTCSTSRPPRIGPPAVEAPMTMPQMPMAMLSFSAGKVARSRPSAAGISSAPNRPWSTRKVTTSGDAVGQADGARGGGEADDADQEGLAVAEAVTELARGDQGDREGEEVAVGDPLDVGEAWRLRSFWMAGLAMATMVPSRATIMTPTATVMRVSHGWPRSPLAGGRSDGTPCRPPAPSCRWWSD